MAIKKFKKEETNKKNAIKMVSAFMVIGIMLAGISYAVYQHEDEKLFINAKVGEFKENDIELAMKLDGEQIDIPPAKDNYIITVDCDNADGSWDSERWGALVTNINANKVKCEVNFKTPGATLSEITATSTKTEISLSYKAEGKGTSTTCKYGTEEGVYPNEVEATNTNCNIKGLENDTTYYYQVCAKNTGGETCKEGSVKTNPETDPLSIVNIGDYISMTPTSTSYTISKDLTGYTSNQTINPSELNLWRVIRKNEDGTVELVSEYVSSTQVYFYGKTGYINYIKALNTIASQYTNEKYVARTRHIGYSNQTEIITDTSMVERSDTPWLISTSKFPGWTTGCPSNDYLCGEYEELGGGDIGYETDYNLLKELYGFTYGTNLYGSVVKYWFNSRLYVYGSQKGWFAIRYVDVYGNLDRLGVYIGDGYTNYTNSAIRPIVILKSTCEISSGSGTKNSPYVLF